MINLQTGRYWDLPWSLVSGCTPCSPGCHNCWALAMEKRFRPRQGDEISGMGIKIHPERLDIPLRRKKPTVWAVWNDLFHEDVPYEFIDSVFFKMTNRHTFLILTKRPKVMHEYFWQNTSLDISMFQNVWLGVTVCTQAEADEKIPILLSIPAAHRWVSIEPMLGPTTINLEDRSHCQYCNGSLFWPFPGHPEHTEHKKIDAVVLGGETGPKARPMHPDWARSVRDQCAAAGVPFFFKQWGEWAPEENCGAVKDYERKYGHHWGDDERGGIFSIRVGRKAAGRILDGREHNELPWSKK